MDYSIVIEENGKRDHMSLIMEKIIKAKKFGYRKIALNVKISSDCIPNKISEPPKISRIEDKIEIYTRLTAKIDDSLQMHKLSQSNIQLQYDILAIDFDNEKILNQFCGGHINCDIVCFDMTNPKLCFLLRKANLNLPKEKGILFEICYTDLLSSQSIRINTISNARFLVEKCKGKNIIISSGAKHKLDFRCPLDAANLALLFNIPENVAKSCIFKNGLRVTKHSKLRKNPLTNVIEEDLNADQWVKNELLETNKRKDISELENELESTDNSITKRVTKRIKLS